MTSFDQFTWFSSPPVFFNLLLLSFVPTVPPPDFMIFIFKSLFKVIYFPLSNCHFWFQCSHLKRNKRTTISIGKFFVACVLLLQSVSRDIMWWWGRGLWSGLGGGAQEVGGPPAPVRQMRTGLSGHSVTLLSFLQTVPS